MSRSPNDSIFTPHRDWAGITGLDGASATMIRALFRFESKGSPRPTASFVLAYLNREGSAWIQVGRTVDIRYHWQGIARASEI